MSDDLGVILEESARRFERLIGLRPTTVLTDVPGAREAARERGLGGLDSKGRPV